MQLSSSRKVRIDRLRRQEDRQRSLAAELLVYQLLEQHWGITTAKLHCKDNGQPYLSGCDLHVSISHSGDWVACAVSSCPVGIDIERIRPGKGSLSHQRITYRNVGFVCKFEEFRSRIGRDGASADEQDRTFGFVDHFRGFSDRFIPNR